MIELFLFGRLLDDDLRAVLVGPLSGCPAQLLDHVVEKSTEQDLPQCLNREGCVVDGLLLEDLDPDDLTALDDYEAIFGNVRRAVTVDCAGRSTKAEAYFPMDDLKSSGLKWKLADWQRSWAPFARRHARQVMDEFRVGKTPAEVASMWPVLSARAQAELAAVERPGPSRDDAPDASRIEDLATRTVYSRFFRLDERDLRVPSFRETLPLEMERTVFLSVDAVTVLPYDPVRDRVLLIEQFRIGPHARGDAEPWLLEAIAGRVDGGENWETTAHREAKEEAGIELIKLEKVAEFYPSPGAMSEFIVAYVGLADLPDGTEGIHGVSSEQEDIRSILVDYPEFTRLMEAGHFRNAPLLVSAQWLAANRDRLRTAANGA